MSLNFPRGPYSDRRVWGGGHGMNIVSMTLQEVKMLIEGSEEGDVVFNISDPPIGLSVDRMV